VKKDGEEDNINAKSPYGKEQNSDSDIRFVFMCFGCGTILSGCGDVERGDREKS
jgi:hypothetical protein